MVTRPSGFARELHHFFEGMYQYDRFHVSRDLRQALRHDRKALRQAIKALGKNDMGSLAIIVTEAMLTCKEDDQKEKLKDFTALLIENQDYIEDYRKRLREQEFEVPGE